MKSSILIIPAVATVLALGVTSCSQSDKTADNQQQVTISEFKVDQTIKTADVNYLVTFDGDTAYFDVSTAIHWPERIGSADIKPLQDSLINYCFGDTSRMGVNKAIEAYLADTSVVDSLSADEKIVRVDSVPKSQDDLRSWFWSVTASVDELNEDMVTYEVSTSSYIGGAHPNTVTHPFTYDLKTAQVLTLDNIFVPEARDSIMPVIVNALARQLNVTPANLGQAEIFVDQLVDPGMPYISNGALVFHYNPYDIAPYSVGPVEVTVYPYEIENWLTPEVKNLFADQF